MKSKTAIGKQSSLNKQKLSDRTAVLRT